MVNSWVNVKLPNRTFRYLQRSAYRVHPLLHHRDQELNYAHAEGLTKMALLRDEDAWRLVQVMVTTLGLSAYEASSAPRITMTTSLLTARLTKSMRHAHNTHATSFLLYLWWQWVISHGQEKIPHLCLHMFQSTFHHIHCVYIDFLHNKNKFLTVFLWLHECYI